MHSLGIVGFGSFGRFMVPHLRPHFEISVCDRLNHAALAEEQRVSWAPLPEVLSRDVVVLAIPVQELADFLPLARPHLRPGTLIIEVASVKVRPLELLQPLADDGLEVCGMHPMFGPQSGSEGIRGLKVVLCPLRCRRVALIRRFLANTLGLEVLDMSPERHDAEMAYIQGLTHWMAKALRELKIPDLRLATPAYRHLMRIEEILREDSPELFLTIQRENPYAREARRQLVSKLTEIEAWIECQSPEDR